MKRCARLSAVVVLLFASVAGAAKVSLAPGLGDASLNVNVQFQAWVQGVENQGPDGKSWNTQAFMRRMRLILSGDLTKQFHFFFNIDSPNFGKFNTPAGDLTGLSSRYLLQDAQLIYEPTPGVFIEAGELLLPLSHNQVNSTLSFLGMDIHSNLIRFPGALAVGNGLTGVNAATNGLRELGIQTRGWALEKKLGWRAGVYNGVRGSQGTYDPANLGSTAGINLSGVPQFGAYLHWNFLDTEERGWLYQGIYFNEKPILSVGGGFGWQPKAIHGVPAPGGGPLPTSPQDWRALAADVFAEFPTVPDQEIIFQFAFHNYDFGANNGNTGNGFFAEAGYRIGEFEPFGSVEYFSGSDVHSADVRLWTAGIAWWVRRIPCNLKAEFESTRLANAASPIGTFDPIKSVTVQWQLFF